MRFKAVQFLEALYTGISQKKSFLGPGRLRENEVRLHMAILSVSRNPCGLVR